MRYTKNQCPMHIRPKSAKPSSSQPIHRPPQNNHLCTLPQLPINPRNLLLPPSPIPLQLLLTTPGPSLPAILPTNHTPRSDLRPGSPLCIAALKPDQKIPLGVKTRPVLINDRLLDLRGWRARIGSRGCLAHERGLEVVGVEVALGQQSEMGQDGGVPLGQVLEGVALGLLEVVGAVQRVHPGVEEEVGPIAAAEEEG